jgi:hypothetical protein
MQKTGWFDAFRDNGSPSDFEVGPAPFVVNQQLIGLLSIFLIPSIAFLIVLPGVRRLQLVSTVAFLFTMLTGAILLGGHEKSALKVKFLILVSIYYPCWQKADTRILANYRAFERQQLNAYLEVRIGLSKVNITLLGKFLISNSNTGTFSTWSTSKL